MVTATKIAMTRKAIINHSHNAGMLIIDPVGDGTGVSSVATVKLNTELGSAREGLMALTCQK